MGVGIVAAFIDFPISVGQRMIRILRGAVSAGTANGALMLCAVIGSPASIGQRMVGIFIRTVSTGGTGYRSAMLGRVVIAP